MYLQALLSNQSNLPANGTPYRGYILLNREGGAPALKDVQKVLYSNDCEREYCNMCMCEYIVRMILISRLINFHSKLIICSVIFEHTSLKVRIRAIAQIFKILKETTSILPLLQIPITEPRPIYFIYSGMGSQWPGMTQKLMKIPIYDESLRASSKVPSFELYILKISALFFISAFQCICS